MSPSDMTESWIWAVTHGVAAILAVLVGVQTVVIRILYRRMESGEKARIDDLRAFNEASTNLHDKVHKTVADINHFIDYLDHRKSRDL